VYIAASSDGSAAAPAQAPHPAGFFAATGRGRVPKYRHWIEPVYVEVAAPAK